MAIKTRIWHWRSIIAGGYLIMQGVWLWCPLAVVGAGLAGALTHVGAPLKSPDVPWQGMVWPVTGHTYWPSQPHICIAMSYPLPAKAGFTLALNLAHKGLTLARRHRRYEADTALFRASKNSNLQSLNTPLTLSKGSPLNTVNKAIPPSFISTAGREHSHAKHHHSIKQMLIMLAGGLCWLTGAIAIMQIIRLSAWQYRLPAGLTKSCHSVDGPLKLGMKAASVTLCAAITGIAVVYGSSLALRWWFPGSPHLAIPVKEALWGILTSIAAGVGFAIILARNWLSLSLYRPGYHRE